MLSFKAYICNGSHLNLSHLINNNLAVKLLKNNTNTKILVNTKNQKFTFYKNLKQKPTIITIF